MRHAESIDLARVDVERGGASEAGTCITLSSAGIAEIAVAVAVDVDDGLSCERVVIRRADLHRDFQRVGDRVLRLQGDDGGRDRR